MLPKYLEEYQQNLDWLEKTGFFKSKEDKDVWFKDFDTGLKLEVDFNRDEDLYYARPVGPDWLTYIFNVQYLERCSFTAEKAVEDCLNHLEEIVDKISNLLNK